MPFVMASGIINEESIAKACTLVWAPVQDIMLVVEWTIIIVIINQIVDRQQTS